jgi:hypothetical protein
VLGGPLEQNTTATISGKEELRQELAWSSTRGYALDLEEYSRGMMCLAAPVVDADGQVAGAFGITALTIHYTQAELVSSLRSQGASGGREASENLGSPPKALDAGRASLGNCVTSSVVRGIGMRTSLILIGQSRSACFSPSGDVTCRSPGCPGGLPKLRAAISDLAEASQVATPMLPVSAASRTDRRRRPGGDKSAAGDLASLRREALSGKSADSDLPGLAVVKRKPKDLDEMFTDRDHHIGFSAGQGREIGMPSNHESNASLERAVTTTPSADCRPFGPTGRCRRASTA